MRLIDVIQIIIFNSEKPNNMNIEYYKKARETTPLEDKKDDELATKLNNFSAVPKSKYPVPMTANQEIGWDLDEVDVRSRWNHSKKTCTETKYAAAYVTMTKHSPYVSKGPGK